MSNETLQTPGLPRITDETVRGLIQEPFGFHIIVQAAGERVRAPELRVAYMREVRDHLIERMAGMASQQAMDEEVARFADAPQATPKENFFFVKN